MKEQEMVDELNVDGHEREKVKQMLCRYMKREKR